ncbi:hypothetical protein ACFL3C_03580 [Patescibacteria group bacterium]
MFSKLIHSFFNDDDSLLGASERRLVNMAPGGKRAPRNKFVPPKPETAKRPEKLSAYEYHQKFDKVMKLMKANKAKVSLRIIPSQGNKVDLPTLKAGLISKTKRLAELTVGTIIKNTPPKTKSKNETAFE